MVFEHYMYAQVANHVEHGRPTDPAEMTLAMVPLAGDLQQAAEQVMIEVAALNDLIEGAEHEDKVFDRAQGAARAIEWLIASAYRLGAHLDVPDLDARIARLLMEPRTAVVTP